MASCEECHATIGPMVSECPRCHARQIGLLIDPASELARLADGSEPGPNPAVSEPISLDAVWTAEALEGLGDLALKELAPATFNRIVEMKVTALHPQPGIRWGLHILSTSIWIIGLAFAVGGSATTAILVWSLWPVSPLLHALHAQKELAIRVPHEEATRQRLAVILTEQIAIRRQRLLDEQLETLRQWDLAQDEGRKNKIVESRNAQGDAYSPPPAPQPLGVSADGAEKLCAYWMKHLGQTNVRVTRAQNDGGVDIESNDWLAQVKHYRGSVGVTEVRELVGVASVDGRTPVFFTSGQYTSSALAFAGRAGVLLFSYRAESGTLEAENVHARSARRP